MSPLSAADFAGFRARSNPRGAGAKRFCSKRGKSAGALRGATAANSSTATRRTICRASPAPPARRRGFCSMPRAPRSICCAPASTISKSNAIVGRAFCAPPTKRGKRANWRSSAIYSSANSIIRLAFWTASKRAPRSPASALSPRSKTAPPAICIRSNTRSDSRARREKAESRFASAHRRARSKKPRPGFRSKPTAAFCAARNWRCAATPTWKNCARACAAASCRSGTYIGATEPLGARADALIPGGHGVCDANFVIDYFRVADERLLFGGRVSYTARAPRDLARVMRARMLRTFPQLADVKIERAWGGNVAITQSRFPDIGRDSDGAHYAQGFSGHGVALSGFAGKLLADAMAGEAELFDVFARVKHRSFPGGRVLRAPILAAAMLYFRLRDLL